MKKLFIANLKMNFTQEQIKDYIKFFLTLVSDKHDVVICPPYTSLSVASQMLFGQKILIGAQNVHQEEFGAYTGEVSAKMLKELACEYVLIGHSERRQYFAEKNKTINLKIKTCMKYGMKPVLCVGETEKEKQTGKTNLVLKNQVEQALTGLYENELKSIVIAYEPVWAIGTGKTPTPKDVLLSVETIRQTVCQIYSEAAGKNLIVLYGGSLKPENAKSFLQHDQINGALVGTASLDAQSFAKIIN
jgi:triosephosphate isomerase (TIM)